MWIGGSPNQPKDAIYPLTGVVETDWSPFTFTMNWRFTRPNHWVRFDAGEPICFFFPVQRALLDDIKPAMAPIDAEPGLLDRFQEWSKGRDAFVLRMATEPPPAPADKWQKHYYRGVDMSEQERIADHRTRLRLKPFDASAIPWPLEPAVEPKVGPPATTANPHSGSSRHAGRAAFADAARPAQARVAAGNAGATARAVGAGAHPSNGGQGSAATNFSIAITPPIAR